MGDVDFDCLTAKVGWRVATVGRWVKRESCDEAEGKGATRFLLVSTWAPLPPQKENGIAVCKKAEKLSGKIEEVGGMK